MLSLALALVLGVQYEDIHQRFTVDLPEQWQLAPMPGDTGGVTFRRTRDQARAIGSIRITEVKKMSLDAFEKSVVSQTEKQKTYRRLAAGIDKLAGVAAYRHRYALDIDEEGKMKKTAEDRMAVINGIGYVIHAESLEQTFDSFAIDFTHFIDTFRPAGQQGPSQVQQANAARLVLVGVWRMEDDRNTVMQLNPNGTMAMAGLTGMYRIDGNKLIMQIAGGQSESFTWSLADDTLTLTAPQLGDPIRYKKQK
jgi:hypothetical protein